MKLPNLNKRTSQGGLATLVLALIAIAFSLLNPETETDAQRYSQKGKRDHIAGQFDYYTLVLSWSPTHCASLPRDRYDPQCDIKRARPYAFVLHGLWPQYTRGYPERCWIKEKPFVPRRLINDMLDIMPSKGLIIHEYKKHGTCSGLNPDGYFKLSRVLYDKIKIPDRYVLPDKPQNVSPDKLMREFLSVNPDLRPDMIAVSCGGTGNRLREVRICFSRDGKLKPCGRNENQRRLCSARSMYVPPVRVSASR